MADFNQQVIDEFRDNAGVVGGMFEGKPLLLLHHVGAKTGTARIAPLVYLAHDDRYAIFASKGGAPKNPAWYHNLLAQPDVEIEVGPKRLPVKATEVTGPERERLYDEQVQTQPQFGDYQAKTERRIPVIVLTPS
jgi:deazaflavin-dependent oxidoreductase (nitroreductase family)